MICRGAQAFNQREGKQNGWFDFLPKKSTVEIKKEYQIIKYII